MKYLFIIIILVGFTSQAFAQYLGDLGYPVNIPHECTAGPGMDCPLEIIDETRWAVGSIAWEKFLYYEAQFSKIETKVTVNDFDMNTHPTIKDRISIQLWSESQPDKITIDQLFETSENSGIFEGYITLSNETSNPLQNKLKVNQTDVIFASYYDWTLPEFQNSTSIEIVASSMVNLHSKTTYDSPLKQFQSGIPFYNIKCSIGFQLTQRYDGYPACVRPYTFDELIKRNWVSNIIKAVQSRDFSDINSTSSYMEKIIPTPDDFKETLSKSHNIETIFSKFGMPHSDIGSGIHIYVYKLDDSTQIWIGYTNQIWYARHVDSDGNILEELFEEHEN